MQRLIEYKNTRKHSSNLQELETDRARYLRGHLLILTGLASEEQMALFDLNVNIYDMLGAFQKLMRRKN